MQVLTFQFAAIFLLNVSKYVTTPIYLFFCIEKKLADLQTSEIDTTIFFLYLLTHIVINLFN
jgi:hypothetical protein